MRVSSYVSHWQSPASSPRRVRGVPAPSPEGSSTGQRLDKGQQLGMFSTWPFLIFLHDAVLNNLPHFPPIKLQMGLLRIALGLEAIVFLPLELSDLV